VPASFDVREVLRLIFTATFFQQSVLAPDALERAMTDGQTELADQAARAEGGHRFAKLDELRFRGRRSFQRLAATRTAKCDRAGRVVLLEAPQPFADGRHGGGEESRGGLAATLPGALDQPQTMVVGVFHLTHQIEINGRKEPSSGRFYSPLAARPSPSRAASSNRLFSLKHFNPARGIRCE
jgi:hypothetical protein